jgi:hypothetical protein
VPNVEEAEGQGGAKARDATVTLQAEAVAGKQAEGGASAGEEEPILFEPENAAVGLGGGVALVDGEIDEPSRDRGVLLAQTLEVVRMRIEERRRTK